MKKIISIILALALISGSIVTCTAVTADDEWKENTGEINLDTMTVSGEGVSVSDNKIVIEKGGDFTVSGTMADGMIYVNSEEKVKLRLSNADITNSKGPAIFFDNVLKGFITISAGTVNSLSDGTIYEEEGADAALFSNDDLEIKGSGILNIVGAYKHGIASDDDISIQEGVINVTSYEHGVKANNKLSVTGGTITVNAETGKGFKAGEELVIDGGDVDITSPKNEGIESKGNLTINGGNISVVAGDDGINTGSALGEAFVGRGMGGMMPPGDRQTLPEMPQGENPQRNVTNRVHNDRGNVTPPEGEGNMTPPNDRENMARPEMQQQEVVTEDKTETENLSHDITINGGTIYINASGDGIDSNGLLTINGGSITVDGPVGNGDGPLDSEGGIILNGGTVATFSSNGMIQIPSTPNNQNILRYTFETLMPEGTNVVITNATGEEFLSHTSAGEFQTVIFSSADLTAGEEYIILVNGEVAENITLQEGVTSVGSAASMFGDRGGMGGRGNGFNRDNKGQSRIRVYVDDKEVRFTSDPVIKNDTTLVGFRGILEALGATVNWKEETQTVSATKDGIEIILVIGSKTAQVNGEEKELLLAPEIINDTTMIPVRFMAEELGMEVNWTEETQTVSIKSNK